MKELSIEEKAKAYDEALEVLKEKFADKEVCGLDKSVLQKLFPQLKESEDEKIRKWLIGYLENRILNCSLIDEKENCKTAVAWLEKQGKNNMGISEATKQKLEDNLNKALEKETPESFNEFLDKQCEQKPYGQRQECVDCQFNYAGECKGSCGMKQGKQNPAWSEEDERMHRGLHNLIYSTPYCDSRKELSDFLDSLKNRLQSNLQQEWTEEDKKCIRLSTDIIDSALRAGFCVQLDRDRCVDWLKSLKDRYTWKPSDLPHWKKSTLPNDNTTGFNSDYFCHKGYCINYKELFEKLPKE